MKVMDIMTSTPVCLTIENNAWEALQMMAERDIGAVLVTYKDNLVGIFTERDMMRKVVAQELDFRSVKLQDVMTRSPVCTHEQEDALLAIRTLILSQHRHLPVVRNQKPVGIISIRNPHLLELVAIAEHNLGFDFSRNQVDRVLLEDFEDELHQYAKETYGTKIYREKKNQGKLDELMSKVRNEFKAIYAKNKLGKDASPTQPGSSKQHGGKPLLFILDDEETTIALYEINMKARGFNVVCFTDAGSLLRRLQWDTPDLLVLDWLLPDKNGMEVIAEVRLLPKMRDVPIVLATSVSFPGTDEFACQACNVDGFLRKPIDFNEMDKYIRQLTAA